MFSAKIIAEKNLLQNYFLSVKIGAYLRVLILYIITDNKKK